MKYIIFLMLLFIACNKFVPQASRLEVEREESSYLYVEDKEKKLKIKPASKSTFIKKRLEDNKNIKKQGEGIITAENKSLEINPIEIPSVETGAISEGSKPKSNFEGSQEIEATNDKPITQTENNIDDRRTKYLMELQEMLSEDESGGQP